MPALTVNNTEPTDSATGFKQKSSNDFPAIQEGVYEAEVARMQYRSKAEFEAEGKTWPAWKKHDAEINIGFRLIDQSITCLLYTSSYLSANRKWLFRTRDLETLHW